MRRLALPEVETSSRISRMATLICLSRRAAPASREAVAGIHAVDARVAGYGGSACGYAASAMRRRPRGLYFHLIIGFPQRPWLELAVGMRRRGGLYTHHIEFPSPQAHVEPYEP